MALACAIASRSESNALAVSTGPKTSSPKSSISGVTFGDQRRGEEQPAAVLAAGDLGAALAGVVEHPQRALQLALGDQRAEVLVLDAGRDRDLVQSARRRAR